MVIQILNKIMRLISLIWKKNKIVKNIKEGKWELRIGIVLLAKSYFELCK